MGDHANDAIDSALDDWVNEHDDERDDYDDVLIKHGTPSSNGRTVDFGSTNRGSSPCGVTIEFKIKIKHKWTDNDWETMLHHDLNAMALARFLFVADMFDLDEHIPFDSEDW